MLSNNELNATQRKCERNEQNEGIDTEEWFKCCVAGSVFSRNAQKRQED